MAPPHTRSASGIPVPTGTALEPNASTPTLFAPIKIRGLELQNRVVVSPMGQWSSPNGYLTDHHLVHLGAYAFRGAALTIVESTAVSATGRTSPSDAGLWMDSQIAPLRKVVEYIHGLGQKIGIQLNHAGSRSGLMVPRLAPGGKPTVVPAEDGGWPDEIWAPSTVPHSENHPIPRALTREKIEDIINDFGDATRRAVEAGVDFIEIHGAHGYLIHQFLSPLTNTRTDDYGGSFENRTRFVLRVIEAIRAQLPEHIPLSLRISATEWMEWSGKPSWDMDQSIRLAKLLPAVGVDILDVSSAGHNDQRIELHPRYQIDLATTIRRALQRDGVDLLIAAVGLITTPEMARDVVQGAGGDGAGASSEIGDDDQPKADLVYIGKQFLREPEFVLRCAQELGVKIQWPIQYSMIEPKND